MSSRSMGVTNEHVVLPLVRSLLDRVHRLHGLLDPVGIEVAHGVGEQARRLAGELAALAERIEVERIVFPGHWCIPP